MTRFQREGFHAFSQVDGYQLIENQRSVLNQAIKGENDDYILNVNREEYIQHLVNQFTISPIEIHRNDLSVSTEEQLIPAEYHPSGYMVDQGDAYARDVVTFHLPFLGDPKLLKVRASQYSLSAPLITVNGNTICFRAIVFSQDAASIKGDANREIDRIEAQNSYLTNDLEKFNASIEQVASQAFDARKKQLLSKNDLIGDLGIPIKKSSNVPTTFSVPAKRTKAIASMPKPEVIEKGHKPEPVLNDKIYSQILKLVHDVGKQFERTPATYSKKSEEQLRDHILLMLEPNFEGAATGETFNKSGKTDILLRHDSKNVFVAELKFWTGPKGFLDTITQLLGYLTWRDSKSLVIMFVRNKDFSSALNKAKESILEHENYLDFTTEEDEGWYLYKFHINDDKSREIKLSVMFFHIPK